MARCAYCKTAILFGGVRDGHERYCDRRCHENGFVLKFAAQVPQETVLNEAGRLHQGPCPKCGGPGPVTCIASIAFGPRLSSPLRATSLLSHAGAARAKARLAE
jgi:hypothetical protein